MRMLIPMIILTTANLSYADWPETNEILQTVRYLSQQQNLPEFQVTVWKAIDQSLPAKPVVLFTNIESFQFKVNPGMNSEFEFALVHLAGDGFDPISIFMDGKLIGRTAEVNGKVQPLVSKFKTPMLYSHDVKLELKLQEKGNIGLIYFDWKNIDYQPIPENIWQVAVIDDAKDLNQELDIEKKVDTGLPEKINGQACNWQPCSGNPVDLSAVKSGTAVAVTHLYRPTNWASLAVKFSAETDATFSINGELKKIKGGQACEFMVKAHKMVSGLNRVVVKMPAGDKAKFKIEVNPDSYYFLKVIPDIINSKLNVDNWPKTTISNGKVTATIALPDAVKGFYRGPRFDHSGMIPELKADGHNYFGINGGLDRQDPLANDQRAAGPSEDFFEPLGFDEAKTGEPFIKIGVGLLRKPYSNKYFFGTAYWPIKFFPWETKVGKDQVEFQQNVSEGDWGYEYKKQVQIPEGKNSLVIKYFLKNTGKNRINTCQYAHNFIRIDDQEISDGYTVEFKGEVTPLRPFPDNVKFNDKNTFVMGGKKTMFCPLQGFKNPEENSVEVSLKDKAGIIISGDFTPYKYWLFASNRVVCPESFIFIDLTPGESLSWTRTYELKE